MVSGVSVGTGVGTGVTVGGGVGVAVGGGVGVAVGGGVGVAVGGGVGVAVGGGVGVAVGGGVGVVVGGGVGVAVGGGMGVAVGGGVGVAVGGVVGVAVGGVVGVAVGGAEEPPLQEASRIAIVAKSTTAITRRCGACFMIGSASLLPSPTPRRLYRLRYPSPMGGQRDHLRNNNTACVSPRPRYHACFLNDQCFEIGS